MASPSLHPDPLHTSRVLVIGGTSGLGAAVASAALAQGGQVYTCSSNPERVASKVAELRTLYPASAINGSAVDLSDENRIEQNIRELLDAATQRMAGPMDHIVYTAGEAFKSMSLQQIDAKTYFTNWNVRCLGPLILAKVISSSPGTYLRSNITSSITLTSGIHAHKPKPGIAAFIGWAGAVETMAKALALDLKPIRVNVVSPGAIRTEMLISLGQEAVDSFGDDTLTGRVGEPSEAAEAYLYSMRASFLTGELIKIDGGAMYA